MNPAIRDWRGKRVWLLGASSGIGAALARELLARGARVALSARKESVLHELAGNAPDALDALVLPCDAARPASLAQACARLVESGAASMWRSISPPTISRCAPGSLIGAASSMIDITARRHRLAACVVPCLLRQGQGNWPSWPSWPATAACRRL